MESNVSHKVSAVLLCSLAFFRSVFSVLYTFYNLIFHYFRASETLCYISAILFSFFSSYIARSTTGIPTERRLTRGRKTSIYHAYG